MFKQKRIKVEGNSEYLGYTDSRIGPYISGWVVNKASNEPVLVRVRCGDEVKYVEANIFRKDVAKQYPDLNSQCGFEVMFSKNNFSIPVVEIIEVKTRLRQKKAELGDKKLFLIHLPKTAGSSFNTIISNSVGASNVKFHIEGQEEQWEKFSNNRYLSGHVRFNKYESYFKPKGFGSAVFLRKPINQLVSHLNWVRHIYDVRDTEFANNHPEAVKKIALQLSVLDYTNPEVMEEFSKNIPKPMYGLFDNMQVRFLANVPGDRRVSPQDCRLAINNLAKIDLLGITEKFQTSIASISLSTGMDLNTHCDVHENQTKYTYGFNPLDVKLKQSIAPLIYFDNLLYKVGLKIFLEQID